MPRSNSFCASALHEVSKCTLPSLSSSDWAKAGQASDTPINTVSSESDGLTMSSLPFQQASSSGILGRSGYRQLYGFRLVMQISPRNPEPCYIPCSRWLQNG